VNKELYNVYLERRKAGYSSKDAVTSARYRLTERAKVALRGWDFDAELVLSRTQESLAWASENNHYGYTVVVFSALDYDSDKLEGVCSTEYTARLDVQPGQRVVSHEEGVYVLGDVVVKMEDHCLDTAYHRKQGMAKQPAIERCVEDQLRTLDWVEKVLNEGVYYVDLEVRIYEAGADTDGDNCLAEASLWGVEATPEYVGEALNKLFDEALDSLTS
jgi:hypothetical protein